MPRKRNPRRGTMQFWPRKRADGMVARIRTWMNAEDGKLAGFAGYKVGMTHVIAMDNRPNTTTKKMDVVMPATIVECPPVRVIGIRTFKRTLNGTQCSGQSFLPKLDAALARVFPLPKKQKQAPESMTADGLSDVRVLVQTLPHLAGFGRKKPEVFELAVGGKDVAKKLETAKALLGKEVRASDTFKGGQQLDAHGVSKGHGVQGPVKRFGIMIRSHKAEKTKRGPGSVGPWTGPGMWQVPKAGQTGFHRRMEHNKLVLKIGDNPAEVNPAGGWLHYGLVKNQYLLLKGSVMGPPKRLITFTPASRPDHRLPKDPPAINYISTASKQ